MRRSLSCAMLFAVAIGLPAARARGNARAGAPRDEDFALQGEYAGCLELSNHCPAWTGLQVVALGNGNFQAVEYAGGLPGNGGTMDKRRKASGKKAEGAVVLTGDDRRIKVRDGLAVFYDSAGRELGRLRKYHRLSQTLRQPPPPGATILFDGSSAGRFNNGSLTPDRLLNVGADTKDAFGDFSLHGEFRTPYLPPARSQGRGNSGIYIQGRYEVQILDSFGFDGAESDCGAVYRTRAPLVNMCFPPLSWQTYDIDFMAARFDAAGHKTANARITVRHNGIVIHKNYEIPNKTGAGAVEGPDPRPIRLQDHGNPVHFRNLWIARRQPGELERPCEFVGCGNWNIDLTASCPGREPVFPCVPDLP